MSSRTLADHAADTQGFLNRPGSAYFLPDGLLRKVYGPEAQAAIARWTDVAATIAPEVYRDSGTTWPGVEIIFASWGLPPVDDVFLARFPDLKVIFYGAGSVRAFVTEAFWRSGVRLVNAVAVNAIPVAEYTCAQIILALKRTWQAANAMRREKKFPTDFSCPGAYRTVVGLLSLGRIGRLVVEKLRSYDLEVIAYDPLVTPEEGARLGVTMCALDEVFARADVVSCHTPRLPETERMLRGQHFEKLKPQAAFINTARGAVVAEEEMIEVLQKRPDLLAILDVTHPEPPIPGSPLYTLDNVVLTPHLAGSLDGECRRMGDCLVEELELYLAGKPLRFELDEARAATMA